MRILMMVGNLVQKGTYWRAFHLSRVLAARGHEVVLMTTSKGSLSRFSEYLAEGVRVLETPDLWAGALRSGWDPWNTIRRIQWILHKSRPFEIVHAFESRPVVLYPARAAKRRGATLIMDWCDWLGRGGSVEERPNLLLRNLLRPIESYFEDSFRNFANGTTVINQVLCQKAVRLGVPLSSIFYLPNGSDVRVPVLSKEEARKILGIPSEKMLIGMVGGLYHRDAKFMAESFRLLSKSRLCCTLVLVGYFNRPIENWLEPGLPILRTGTIPYRQTFAYLSACDLLWLPLRNTGANRGRFPLKLNDYMSVGRPVVATDVDEIGQLIRRHSFGITTKDDPESFSSATEQLLMDSDRKEAMGEAARLAAEAHFNWDRIGESLEKFYECQIQHRGPGDLS
jgi:glycosyltransferase involved in cell wall biosynthesis